MPEPNRPLRLPHANAICYSGYRDGQSPLTQTYPSVDEIREDLTILARHWSYLRLYDCSTHAERVLEVIRADNLDLKVMLGMDNAAELSNPNCPWDANFSDEQLASNRRKNAAELERLIALATGNEDIVAAVSIGNESSVEWTDHLVPVDQLIAYARELRRAVRQPITFCENYVPWVEKLHDLAAELDFISIHTYPVWEYRTLDDALAFTQQNYQQVADRFPSKPVVITEAGWTSASNGRGMEPDNASEELQARYYEQLLAWTNDQRVLTFVFEAFDEPWKGSPDPLEPEKHWGLFRVDRSPKLVMQEAFSDLARNELTAISPAG
ncbi:MAG: glycosyl hydrolase family 17 protein [Pseudomonadota bacterium]